MDLDSVCYQTYDAATSGRAALRPQEWGRGTQECVRHGYAEGTPPWARTR